MKKTKGNVNKLTRGALIAALYVTLTYLSSILGLANGAVQIRISEALCILPIIMPEAIPGLVIGCMLSNLLTSGVLWDILFGSLATLIGAVIAYLMRGVPQKLKWTATTPTIISNALIVPPVLIFAYGIETAYPLILLGVLTGEIISCGIFGSLLYYSLPEQLKRNCAL